MGREHRFHNIWCEGSKHFDDDEPLGGRGWGRLVMAFLTPCAGVGGLDAELTWSQRSNHYTQRESM